MANKYRYTLALLLVAACAGQQKVPEPVVVTKVVKVPVAQARAVPPELFAPVVQPGDVPAAVAPSDPAAVIAYTAEGVTKLQLLIGKLQQRIDALITHATE